MVQVKATMLRTRLDFLGERFGPDALRSVLEALPEDDRKTLHAVLPSSWVPFTLLNRLDDVIVRKLGGGQTGVIEQAGAYSALKNLTSIYKIFVDQARGDPQSLMESLSGMHATFYDWGGMRAHAVSPERCRMEMDYLGSASRTNCRSAIGFYSEALRQLHLKAVRVEETTCQADGASLCVYDVAWER
jgi:hypothetical protein